MKRLPQKTVKAVYSIAVDLAGKSAKLAPIESGDLRNNCHADVNGTNVFKDEKRTKNVVVPTVEAYASIGYSEPYALRQHEDLTLRHDRKDGYTIKTGEHAGLTVNKIPGGEAKFLERPFNENAHQYLEKLEKIIDESWGVKK